MIYYIRPVSLFLCFCVSSLSVIGQIQGVTSVASAFSAEPVARTASDRSQNKKKSSRPRPQKRHDLAERRAIEWAVAAGGDVSAMSITPRAKRALDVNAGTLPEDLIEVYGMSFSWDREFKVDDAGLTKLKGLRKIRSFRLYQRSDITNEGLAILGSLPTLTGVSIRNHRQITDDGFKQLARIKNLTDLDAPATGVTDDGLAHLKTLPLRGLALNQNNLSNEACTHLSAIKTLERLSLSYNRGIDDKGVSRLRRIPRLQSLNLNFTGVTSDVVDYLTDMQELHSVALIGTPLDDKGLAKLTQLRLTSLFVADTEITDTGIKKLSDIPTLQIVNIGDNPITDKGLAYLHNVESLRAVYMKNTEVSKHGIAALQKALPDCRIID